MPSNSWKLLIPFLIIVNIYLLVSHFGLSSVSAAFEPRQQQTPSSSPRHDGLKVDIVPGGHGLRLRHIFQHGAGQRGPRARRLDISPANVFANSDQGLFSIKTTQLCIDRPAGILHDKDIQSPFMLPDYVRGPDVTCKDSVINFANMSEDAYHYDPSDAEWLDVGEKWNDSLPFGWDDHGIRGQVFSDETNSTVVLSIKGTSVSVYEGNGTSLQDKDNDNLFGSCCCGQGGSYLWKQVCDCQTKTYTCNENCVKSELKQPNRYFEAVSELYDEVIQLYPRAAIITTGHSLGGVLASLIGLHHGVPHVTFEAYPQALAASRLGLATSGKNTGGFHFGHTADPVYMGTCNSASSFCSIAGYAFETHCHTGKRCVYDVVKDWGWRQSTGTHRLRYAIENIYSKYNETAPCHDEEVDCVDCFLWKFENGTHTKPPSATSTVTTTIRTRTETCKTPGWWGCRDESTTSGPTTSAEVTTTSTSTCKTPGWFGCKDQTTTTGSPTSSSESSTTTTTCTTKGWFGRCLDATSTATTTAATEAAYWRMTPTPTQTS
ncbi:Alpha/Beta hydrolase protein [Clohesyomyces aquaticus]|uniref:triacylglycerol lipase n=1 Tax=Clohesyomyces aquaticus TaxID=1231657 RepID=A0A1Y1YKZ2_9PLEO|nr:Alpha/Beta hydrolase protein [Clohesyomyces aquaticus]